MDALEHRRPSNGGARRDLSGGDAREVDKCCRGGAYGSDEEKRSKGGSCERCARRVEAINGGVDKPAKSRTSD